MTPKYDKTAIGRRIQSRREEMGFKTLGDFQEALGKHTRGGKTVRVALSTISNWETGKVVPTAHLQLLSEVLRKSQDWIIWGRESAGSSEAPPDERHVQIVSEYLDSPRGKTTHPRVQEQLLEGDIFAAFPGEITWDDVDDARRVLERRIGAAAVEKAIEPDSSGLSGMRITRSALKKAPPAPAKKPARR